MRVPLAAVESHVNWSALTATLATVLLITLPTCTLAAHAALKGRLLDALREE